MRTQTTRRPAHPFAGRPGCPTCGGSGAVAKASATFVGTVYRAQCPDCFPRVTPPARPAPAPASTPAGCALCGGTGEHRHYAFRRGAWVPVKEPCPQCQPPLQPAA